jgi:ABC-type Zn uptake system ZnuABC Zn-binding protein ZnuA
MVMGVPWQSTDVGTAMETAGLTVVVTTMFLEDTGEVAQDTYAVTVMPPADDPAKACMLVPVVVPLHPEGKVQV